MIGQNIGLRYLIPLALDRLTRNLFVGGDFYRSDCWACSPARRASLLAEVAVRAGESTGVGRSGTEETADDSRRQPNSGPQAFVPISRFQRIAIT